MYSRYCITGAVTNLLFWLCEDLKNCRINILRWQIGCIIQTQKVEGGGGEENLHSKCTPVFHTKNAVPSYAWILLQNFWTLPIVFREDIRGKNRKSKSSWHRTFNQVPRWCSCPFFSMTPITCGVWFIKNMFTYLYNSVWELFIF